MVWHREGTWLLAAAWVRRVVGAVRGCQGRSGGMWLAPGVGGWSVAWESRNRAWVDLGSDMGKG